MYSSLFINRLETPAHINPFEDWELGVQPAGYVSTLICTQIAHHWLPVRRLCSPDVESEEGGSAEVRVKLLRIPEESEGE